MFHVKHYTMKNTTSIGSLGEDIACDYLKSRGQKILFRNVRFTGGELDIVSRETSGLVLFVEVKTIQGSDDTFRPEDNFSRSKKKNMDRAIQLFSVKHPELFNEKLGWRADLITMRIKNSLLTDYNKDCEINYYENV